MKKEKTVIKEGERSDYAKLCDMILDGPKVKHWSNEYQMLCECGRKTDLDFRHSYFFSCECGKRYMYDPDYEGLREIVSTTATMIHK